MTTSFTLQTADLNAIQSNLGWRRAPHQTKLSWLYAAAKWCEAKKSACIRCGSFDLADRLGDEATGLFRAYEQLRSEGPQDNGTNVFRGR